MDSAILKQTLTGTKFMVVDDEPDNIGVLVTLLTSLGAVVSTAEDGAQGLECARANRPDVILADLSMPVMTGWEMLYNLKQDEALQVIPVIALTAHAMAGDR